MLDLESQQKSTETSHCIQWKSFLRGCFSFRRLQRFLPCLEVDTMHSRDSLETAYFYGLKNHCVIMLPHMAGIVSFSTNILWRLVMERQGCQMEKGSGEGDRVVIKVLTTDKTLKGISDFFIFTIRNQRVILFCYFPASVTDSENSKYHLIKNAHCPYLWKPPHCTWSIFPMLSSGMQNTDVFLDSLLAPLGAEELIHPSSPTPPRDWCRQSLEAPDPLLLCQEQTS